MKLEEKVKKYLDKIKKEDLADQGSANARNRNVSSHKKINSFLELNPNVLEEAKALDKKGKKGKLYGKVIAVKSNINVLGLKTSCASKTLENYKATYDATVIERIKKEDGLIIGMVNCDEFACGWTGETSAFGKTDNPLIPGHVPGGSSSGSAAAVSAGFCDVALGSDTGGSIRVPASFCGVVGIKPSYGYVSRYGMVDLCMSIDQIGTLAKNVEDAALVLDVIKGKDERDTKTFDSKDIQIKDPGKVSMGIVKVAGVDQRISDLIDEKTDELVKKFGWKKSNLDIKHIELSIQAYHLLVSTEFYSATRRFDGRRYGEKIEDSAGKEVLRRILGGSEIAKAEHAGRYYHKALKVKEFIKKEFEEALKKVDCLIMPTVPVLPWKFGKKVSMEELYAVDALTIPSNLAEVCAISIPIGNIDDGIVKSVGMQIICGKNQESKMLSIADKIDPN